MLKHLGLCALALVAATTPALAGNGTNLLKHIPETSQMVFVVDLAGARDSALVQKYYGKLLDSQPDARTKLADIGLDPQKDIDTVLFAGSGIAEMSGMSDAKEMVLIIEGRFPKDRLAAMAGVQPSKHQGIAIYTKNETDVAFIGERLFFTRKGKMPGAIDVALGKGAGKGKNVASSAKAKKLRDAIASSSTSNDVWMVVLVPDKDKTTMKQSGMEAESVSATVDITDHLAATLRIGTSSPTVAKDIVDKFLPVLPQLTGMLGKLGLSRAAKTITLVQDKAAVVFTGSLTDAELSALVALAGGGASTPPPAPKPAPVVPKTGGLGGAAKP